MRNVVFLHKRTLYFAVASRKGCVDFSSKLLLWCSQIEVASRKGCVDLSVMHFFAFFSIFVASREGCVDFSSLS